MIRTVLIFLLLVLIYQAARIVFRSASRAAREKDDRPGPLPGREMVLDPECRTYVVKDRAVVRSVRGTTHYYCSESCARKHEARGRA